MTIDNISVRLADADRSVNANGLAVHGTIYKRRIDYVSSSNTGTEDALVAYSNFSTSNYLSQPYNSDLDFGTGDFSVMGWYKLNSTPSTGYIFSLADPNGNNVITFYLHSDGKVRVGLTGGTQEFQNWTATVWQHLVVLRRDGVVYTYLDGGSEISNSILAGGSDADLSITSTYKLYLGRYKSVSTNYPFDGSLALWRISATAPSAEQIKDIYEAEKVLFQENAKCTLNGSSDSVTAMSYDDSNDELLVGTSGGLSVFKGLRRVDENTNAITEVAQQGNLRVEEY